MAVDTQKSSKHYWLYVIALKQGKYYIGITSLKNPQQRIDQHKRGYYSAQWVRQYGYKSTLDVRDLGYLTHAQARRQENRYTLAYMKKYGLQNVRGGDLVYRGKYYKLFGGYLPDFAWESIAVIVLLLLIILVLELRWITR